MYEEEQDYQQAIETYTKGIDQCDESDLLYKYLGDCHSKIGEHDKALQSYDKALICTQNPIFILSYIHWEEYGTWTSRDSEYINPVSLCRQEMMESFLWFNRVKICIDIHKTDEVNELATYAIKHYEAVIESNIPNNLLLWCWSRSTKNYLFPWENKLPISIIQVALAEAYIITNEITKAIEAFQKALKTISDSDWLCIQLVKAHSKLYSTQR